MSGAGARARLAAAALWTIALLDPSPGAAVAESPAASAGEQVETLVASEELILDLTPQLMDLASAVKNLALPDHRTRDAFAAEVAVNDLFARGDEFVAGGITEGASGAKLVLWRALLDQVDYFEHAGFKFVSAAFSSDSRENWKAKVAFSGLARRKDGSWVSLHADIDTDWGSSPASGAAPRSWKISGFRVEDFSASVRERRMFGEVLEQAIVDPAVAARSRESIQEKHLLALARDPKGFRPPHRYFRVKPTDSQPGIAVVDIDRDGWDDLYVMDRWGVNLLLRNRGDGSFDEAAAEAGLAVEDHSSSAIFADFDNDGDDDVFVGRTLEPSLYLVNEDGRFVDRSSEFVSTPLPRLVTSVSAADVNDDGLLDVYFSTYAADLIFEEQARQEAEAADGVASGVLLSDFLDPKIAGIITRIYRENHKFLHRGGPPNLLLLNAGGGRFERSPHDAELEIWRNTFQSSWADYDGDGDPDLYVANDYSHNNLLRNDGGGRFVDVTAATGTADIGFGMGVSWGDYDEDGSQDLYVSNMYSKAGRRITSQTPGIDPRIADMSHGNTLFRNQSGVFEKVSGESPPDITVEKAGWSWGGQFVDVDNDGDLDLYASSGFYTAPGEVAIKGADL